MPCGRCQVIQDVANGWEGFCLGLQLLNRSTTPEDWPGKPRRVDIKVFFSFWRGGVERFESRITHDTYHGNSFGMKRICKQRLWNLCFWVAHRIPVTFRSEKRFPCFRKTWRIVEANAVTILTVRFGNGEIPVKTRERSWANAPQAAIWTCGHSLSGERWGWKWLRKNGHM